MRVRYWYLQRNATRSNTLQHAVTCCNTLQHSVCGLVCSVCVYLSGVRNTQQHAATRCNTLQHSVCGRVSQVHVWALYTQKSPAYTPKKIHELYRYIYKYDLINIYIYFKIWIRMCSNG